MTDQPTDTCCVTLPDDGSNDCPFAQLVARAESNLLHEMSTVGYTGRPYYLARYERRTHKRSSSVSHWFWWKVEL